MKWIRTCSVSIATASDTKQWKERQKTGKPFVKCNYCGKTGHESKDCWNRKTKSAVAYTEDENVSNNGNVNEVSSGFLMDENKRMSNEDISECVKDNKLHLANGTRVDIITNVCNTTQPQKKMPLAKGLIGNEEVSTLRDTGCNGIVVKQKFVKKEDYTGEHGFMLLVDNTVRKAPFAMIEVDTPYLKGRVKALCLPDVIYDLIIGNVDDALPPDAPDLSWTINKEAEKKAEEPQLKVCVANENKVKSKTIQSEEIKLNEIDKKKFQELQRKDKSI